jgi:hypothetical protein
MRHLFRKELHEIIRPGGIHVRFKLPMRIPGLLVAGAGFIAASSLIQLGVVLNDNLLVGMNLIALVMIAAAMVFASRN